MGETNARFPQDVLRAVIVDADTVDFHTDLAEKFRFDFKGANHPFPWIKGAKLRWSVEYEGTV